MRYFFLLLITLMAACWCFEAPENHNLSSPLEFPLFDLPTELIPEVANQAPYRDYQRLSSTCKQLRDTLKAFGRRIEIVQEITEKNHKEFIAVLERNFQVRGVIFNSICTPFESFENLVPTLKTMGNLKELQLNDPHISQKLINVIADIKQLEKLTILGLRNLKCSAINLDICSTLPKLHTLELDTLWCIDFKAFQSHATLKSLSIRSGYLKDNDLLALSKVPGLTELNLEKVDLRIISHTAGLPVMPQVKSMVNCYNLPSLADITKLFPNLTKLIDSASAFTSKQKEQLQNLSNLTILDIAFSSIENIEDSEMGIIGTLINLTDLNLSRFWKASAVKFTLLNNLTILQKLDVSNTNFANEGMKAITHLPLTSLNLSRCDISPQTFTLLGQCQLLQELNLERTQVNMAGMEAIGNLTSLTDLNLSHCQLGLNSIGCLKPLFHLQKLDLSYTAIDDDGVRIISKFSNLKKLVLLECLSITPEGFLPLHNTITLEFLNVAKTLFDETFFILLFEEKENKRDHPHLLYLHNITFSDGCCSVEYLNKIRMNFPRLKIVQHSEKIG